MIMSQLTAKSQSTPSADRSTSTTDMLRSVPLVESAQKLIPEMKSLLNEGGFKLTSLFRLIATVIASFVCFLTHLNLHMEQLLTSR